MIRIIPCLLAVLMLSTSASARNFLEEYLPERTLASVSLQNSSALMEALEYGAIAQMAEEGDIEEWMESLKEPIELAGEEPFELPSGNQLSVATLNELFNNRICIGVIAVPLEGDGDPDLVLLADFAGDVEALKYLQMADREVEADQVILIQENYAGVSLFTEELDQPQEEWMAEYWALVDGIAVETTSMELLKNTVDAIIDAQGSGLGNSEHFQRAVDLSPGAQLRLYLNLQAGVDILKKMMESDMGGVPMNFLAVTNESLWASLSLESLNALFIAMDFESPHLDTTFGLLYDERDGLLSLLDYSQDPLRLPHWVPVDAVDSMVAMIDFPGVFSALEAILNDMSPSFGSMFQLQLDKLRQETNIDLRESLFNNFGDQYISFTVWDEQEESTFPGMESPERMVVAAPLRDPQAFQNSVKALTEMVMPGVEVLESREFLDFTIMTPANHGMEDAPFGYALADGYLFLGLGSVELLERTLYNLRESSDGLWTQSHIVKAIEDLPSNPVEANYYNVGSALEELYALYHSEIASELEGEWDLPEITEFNLPYYIISAGYVLEDAQVTRARILPKKP